MNKSSDPAIVTIIISYKEYLRLLHIEEQYLKLQQNKTDSVGKANQDKKDGSLPVKDAQLMSSVDQTGSGFSSTVGELGHLVTKLVLSKIKDKLAEAKDVNQSSLLQKLEHYLTESLTQLFLIYANTSELFRT